MTLLSLVLAVMIQPPQPPPPPLPLVRAPVPTRIASAIELPLPGLLTRSHYRGLRLIYAKAPVSEDLGVIEVRSDYGPCNRSIQEAFDKLVEEAARRGATAAAEVRTDQGDATNFSARNFVCRSGIQSGVNTGTVVLTARLVRP